MLTKWWKLELLLATNFGNHAQMVTKFGGQILATKFGFVPDCLLRPSDTYICVSDLTFIASDNGLAPGQRQAIIWTNAEIL